MRKCDFCTIPNDAETPYFELHVEIRKWKNSYDIETQKNAGGDFCSIKCVNAFVESIGNGILTRSSD